MNNLVVWVLVVLFGITAHQVGAFADSTKLSAQVKQQLKKPNSSQSLRLIVYFKDNKDIPQSELLAAEQRLSDSAKHRRFINRGPERVVDSKDLPVDSNYIEQLRVKAKNIRHVLKSLNAVSIDIDPVYVSELADLDFVDRIAVVNRLTGKLNHPKTPSLEVSRYSSVTPKTIETLLDYGASSQQVDQLNIPALHDLGFNGEGIRVAVFDAGFSRLGHESLSSLNIAETWDFVNNDSDVSDGLDMGIGEHGIHTLSSIAGYSPGNLIGPAFGATFYLAKTENTEQNNHLDEDNWCAAMEWAEQRGVQIIASSLNYTEFDEGNSYAPSDMDGETALITVCAEQAADFGMLVVNSAGNAGDGTTTIGAPSDGISVLTVGALQVNGERASFSGVGPTADGRIKPDVMAPGSNIWVAGAESDNEYLAVAGTSFACPLVAGVAAQLMQANPNLTAVQVRDLLRDTADDFDRPNSQIGYGAIDGFSALTAISGSFTPKARFNASTNSTATASFQSTSVDPDGAVVSYLWDFGDKQTSTDQRPNHRYEFSGTYQASLTVIDDDGFSDIEIKTVSIAFSTEEESSGGGSFTVWLLIISLLIAVSRMRLVGDSLN